MSCAFTVPYPPQANHMYTVARGRKIKSADYRSWKDAAAFHIKAQRVGQVLGHYTIEIIVPRPDRRGRDIDNLIKPISDAVALAGVITNDNLAMSIRISWGSIKPIKGEPVRVIVSPYVEDVKARMIMRPMVWEGEE